MPEPVEPVAPGIPESLTLNETFSIGKATLKLGSKLADIDAFGEVQQSPAEYWEASGEYVEEWVFSEHQMKVEAASFTRNGAKEIRSIRVFGNCRLKTSKGIGIGSSRRELFQAYGQHFDPEDGEPGAVLVFGSRFDGLIFQLEDGVVKAYFVGAASE